MSAEVRFGVGRIEEFDSNKDYWFEYKERLDQYFKANGLAKENKNERKVAVFLTVIGSSAYKLLQSLMAPDLPASKSYQELTEALAKHLALKPLAIAE